MGIAESGESTEEDDVVGAAGRADSEIERLG